jgi:hypothetical protein
MNGHGGHRPGAGRPKGSKDPHTLEKQEYEFQLRARIARDVDAYYEAMKQAATGVTHLMAKDKDGTWKEVTDPAVMARCLNSGESFYQLSARNPDVRALINLFDRLCGSATQQSQVQVESQVTLKDLIVASWKSDGDDH